MKPITKIKKNHDVSKNGDVQRTKWYMQKVLFYYEDFLYQASVLQPMLSTNKVVHAEETFCYKKKPSVPSIKTTTFACNRFNTSICTEDHKTHLAISCCTLLHQTARYEGNSLGKRRDILVSDRDQQWFFIIIVT